MVHLSTGYNKIIPIHTHVYFEEELYIIALSKQTHPKIYNHNCSLIVHKLASDLTSTFVQLQQMHSIWCFTESAILVRADGSWTAVGLHFAQPLL